MEIGVQNIDRGLTPNAQFWQTTLTLQHVFEGANNFDGFLTYLYINFPSGFRGLAACRLRVFVATGARENAVFAAREPLGRSKAPLGPCF